MSRRQWFVARKHCYSGGSDVINLSPFADASAQFKSGNGFLSLAGGLPLDPSQAFTVSWWWIFDQGSATPNLFQWGNLVDENGTAGDQIRFAFENGLGVSRAVMWASDGTSSSPGGGGDHIGLPWRFQSIIYDPSTFPPNPTIRQSINANAFASNTAATALMRPAAGTTWWLGQGPVAATWGFHPGRIDALMVHAGALTLPQVALLFNGGAGFNKPSDPGFPTGLPALIAAYPFDEPSGSAVWHDVSGNGHHLAATGTVQSGGPRNT